MIEVSFIDVSTHPLQVSLVGMERMDSLERLEPQDLRVTQDQLD